MPNWALNTVIEKSDIEFTCLLIYSIYVQKYASIEYSMKVKKFITWVLNGFSDVLMYSSNKKKIYLLSFQSNKTFTKLSTQ